MSVNKLQNFIQSSNGMSVPSFTLTRSEIISLKQKETPKKENLSDKGAAINSTPNDESSYTKKLNTTNPKVAYTTVTYDNTKLYNYKGTRFNQLTKILNSISPKAANSL